MIIKLLQSFRKVLRADRISSWQVDGLWRLLVEELVKEADVGKRPSGHDGVVPSA